MVKDSFFSSVALKGHYHSSRSSVEILVSSKFLIFYFLPWIIQKVIDSTFATSLNFDSVSTFPPPFSLLNIHTVYSMFLFPYIELKLQ